MRNLKSFSKATKVIERLTEQTNNLLPSLKTTYGLALGVLLCAALHSSKLNSRQISLHFSDYLPMNGVDKSQNEIQNAKALNPFVNKLVRLRLNTAKKVRVFHFGDAENLGDKAAYLGDRLQASFGAGGKGFLFPESIQKNDEIKNNWKLKGFEDGTRLGLGGFTLLSKLSAQSFKIDNRNSADAQNRIFDKVTVLHHNRQGNVHFELDVPSLDDNIQPQWKGEMSASFILDESTPSASLTAKVRSGNRGFNIDGILLEKNAKGVVYNQIALQNGTFDAVAKARYLPRQLGEQFPDLIVLSLGYQEAQVADLDRKTFEQSVNSLLKVFAETCPGATVLLTTPVVPTQLLDKYPSLTTVAQVLRKVSRMQTIPMWDAQHFVGAEAVKEDGRGEVQGQLMYQALIAEFNRSIQLIP